ncbi:hypothetical protein NECAME_14662 [Necator americanus]|uniref:Uncharacterized protein n=1 Tax=Necator americanus TaxID=51031 RepID=W2SPI3_NECAM|nr:hypothetical protein NECAME_14662 [Necator americanus]ETN70612.1 hypothetical protein NECAME_14662 [Necator americanus]
MASGLRWYFPAEISFNSWWSAFSMQIEHGKKVLFLQSALRHASSGSNSKIWSCPVSNCNFAASAASQQVVHHIRRHVPVCIY